MGGFDSAVSDTTTDILLEAAYFNPSRIRKSAKKAGISSDSSYRYERGIDPYNVKRASELIAQGKKIKIDLGYVKTNQESRYFSMMLGVGFVPSVIKRVNSKFKKKDLPHGASLFFISVNRLDIMVFSPST